MFNKKLKNQLKDALARIETLESQVKGLISNNNKLTDIINENFVSIKGEKEIQNWGLWMLIDHTFYFPKGTEPNCDYIKEDRDGKRTYYKKDVICDEKGNIKK